MEDNKPSRPKLTLSRNISSTRLAEKLKAFTGNDAIIPSKNDNNKQSIVGKVGTIKNKQNQENSELQKQKVLPTKNSNNDAKSIKSKDKNAEKTIKKNEAQTVNLISKKNNKSNNKADGKVKEEQPNKPGTIDKKGKKLEEKKNISFKGMLSKLRQLYPITFPADETKLVALKVGINNDIKKDIELMNNLRTSITYLGKFLKWYTSSRNYRILTQVEGNARYDLQGQVVGMVTKEQALDAKKLLERNTSNNLANKTNDIPS